MENPDLPETGGNVVELSEAISHAGFDPLLRQLVLALSERPEEITLDGVAAVLRLDRLALAQALVATAVGAEVLRCAELDAAKARGLN